MKNQLYAGAAEINITPTINTQIAGDIGRKRPALLVLEPLYAKALALEAGGAQYCILSLDLLAATKDQTDVLRRDIEAKYGIPKENVVVHVTQNHAAPSLGHMMVPPADNLLPKTEDWAFLTSGDDKYSEMCRERVVRAVGEATQKKQAVHVGAAREIDGRFAFNRRVVMRDGRLVGEPPKMDKNILYVDGPVDPEVGVLLFVNDALENVAVLLHHTCHPTVGYPHNYICSDWPGAWCDQMRAALGGRCVPLVINGCCGNINHMNKIDPDHDFADYKGMGAGLAQSAVKALKRLTYMETPALKSTNYHLQIPMRQISDEELSRVRKIYKEHPMPKWNGATNAVDWDWWIAVSALDTYNHWGPGSLFDYEIQALRIGDFGMIALGGEPFVEGQLDIKLRSPAAYTFVAHMCNYYVGYVPVKRAVEKPGSWDTYTSLGSKLDAGALDMIADESVSLLNVLFDKNE